MKTVTADFSAITVCIIDGVYRLILESWYIIVPVVAIFADHELGQRLGLMDCISNIRNRGMI